MPPSDFTAALACEGFGKTTTAEGYTMPINKPTFESKPRQAAWDVNYSREWIYSNTKAGVVYGNWDITHLFIEAHGETVESISSEDYYGTHHNLCAALDQCCFVLNILSHAKDNEGGNIFTRH